MKNKYRRDWGILDLLMSHLFSNLFLIVWNYIDFVTSVRMAERSKAPDSRVILLIRNISELSVLVLSEGVGSNPTSDNIFLHFFVFFFLETRFLHALSHSDLEDQIFTKNTIFYPKLSKRYFNFRDPLLEQVENIALCLKKNINKMNGICVWLHIFSPNFYRMCA